MKQVTLLIKVYASIFEECLIKLIFFTMKFWEKELLSQINLVLNPCFVLAAAHMGLGKVTTPNFVSSWYGIRIIVSTQ